MTEFIHPAELNAPTGDAWRLFRIIAEFVEGFERLPSLGPSISIFGSSKLSQTSPYYEMARELAFKLSKKGFSIITGAGPSLMEAANKGAQEAGGNSCGLIIDLPFELEPNAYIDPKLRLSFRYFFVRKVMFLRYAQGVAFLPGGFGTFDELFEVITLIQTKKTLPVPIYLIGSAYWKGLIEWLRNTVAEANCISKEDVNLFHITDNIDEVVAGFEQAYKDRLKLLDVANVE